jgi:tetratricopeptide (TPR) repeat protein
MLLAESSGRAWATLGLSSENHARANRLLALLPEREHGARALLRIAIAFFDANDGRRASAFESTARAVESARAAGDRRILVQALLAHARHCATLPDELEAAQAAVDEAADAIADLPREYHVRTLHERAFLGMQRGDFAEAARAYERLREEHRALGNAALMDLAALGLAEVEHARGRSREAVAIVTGMLPDLRTRRDRQIAITLLANLAGYYVSLDELDAASDAAREVVRELVERDPGATFLAVAIEHLALALALGGDTRRGAILHGFAEAALLRSGFERLYTEYATRDRMIALLDERLGAAERAQLAAEGAALEAATAADLALRVG